MDDPRVLEIIARLGSVRSAADKLALSHGAVSRCAANLAAALRSDLLEPDGHGLRLTQYVAQLADAASHALALVAGAPHDIRQCYSPAPILLLANDRGDALADPAPVRLSGPLPARGSASLHTRRVGGF